MRAGRRARVRLDTLWGSFHAYTDGHGRLYCPICRAFYAYDAKSLVYHLSFHARGEGDAQEGGRSSPRRRGIRLGG